MRIIYEKRHGMEGASIQPGGVYNHHPKGRCPEPSAPVRHPTAAAAAAAAAVVVPSALTRAAPGLHRPAPHVLRPS